MALYGLKAILKLLIKAVTSMILLVASWFQYAVAVFRKTNPSATARIMDILSIMPLLSVCHQKKYSSLIKYRRIQLLKS